MCRLVLRVIILYTGLKKKIIGIQKGWNWFIKANI